MQKKSVIERLKKWAVALVPNLEPIALAVLAVGTASMWGFIESAAEVLEGGMQAFAQWALTSLRDPANPADRIGPRWLEEMARAATALGGVAWITFTTIVIAVYLWLVGKTRLMLFMLA